MFPQLAQILRAYMFGPRLERPGRLLFPSFSKGAEAQLVDVRKLVNRIAVRAGWKAGDLGTRVFRHTFTAARLQTLDQGAPVSVWTVSRELGHSSEELVRRIYGHVGTIRHRSEVVEFWVEQHLEALKDRLGKVGLVTRARRDSNARPLAPEAADAGPRHCIRHYVGTAQVDPTWTKVHWQVPDQGPTISG